MSSTTVATLTLGANDSGEVGGVISQPGGGVLSLVHSGSGTTKLAGVHTYTGLTTIRAGALKILENGSIVSNVVVKNDANLGGKGNPLGNVKVEEGGSWTPGLSPGIQTIPNDVSLTGSVLEVELNGNVVGVQYDQIQIQGAGHTVTLGGAQLNVLLGFTPAVNDAFTIILADAGSSVAGTFSDSDGNVLAEDAKFEAGGWWFRINYAAGDGNDVVLTVLSRASDFSDAPASYGAANHLLGTLRLGEVVDAELDSATVDGDADTDDGVEFGSLMIGQSDASMSVLVTNTAGRASYINAWIDFNQDGDFDPNEQIASGVLVSGTDNVLHLFNIPADATIGETVARVRVSSVEGLSATGSATNGEVEDYTVTIQSNLDFGDAPGSQTSLIADGPRHIIGGPVLGSSVDTETQDTNLEGFETGDFSALPWRSGGAAPWTITSADKSGGVYSARAGAIADQQDSSLEVTLDIVMDGTVQFDRKTSSQASDFLVFWIDDVFMNKWWGVDSSFTRESFPITAGRHKFAWAFITDPPDEGATGSDTAFLDGIVFPPHAQAVFPLDDTNQAADDEDGILFGEIQATAGGHAFVRVDVSNASAETKLDAWIDFDGNGRFSDAGEQIFANQAVVNGRNRLEFTLPTGVTAIDTYARFRVSTAGNLAPIGLAADGEVEDHPVTLVPARAPVAGTTTISLVGGDLVITGSAADDLLTVSTDLDYITIHDPTHVLNTAITFAYGNGTNTIRVPLVEFDGKVIINTAGGADRLTLDYGSGNFDRPIQFDGGGGESDQLLLQNATFNSKTISYLDATTGAIELTNNASLSYLNTELLSSSVDVDTLTFDLGDAASDALLRKHVGGGLLRLESNDATLSIFKPPTRLAINANGGDDQIRLDSDGARIAGGTVNFIENMQLFVDGGTGTNTLTIIDSTDTTPGAFTVTQDSISGSNLIGSGSTLRYNDIDQISIDAASANTHVIVNFDDLQPDVAVNFSTAATNSLTLRGSSPISDLDIEFSSLDAGRFLADGRQLSFSGVKGIFAELTASNTVLTFGDEAESIVALAASEDGTTFAN
ncbi:MAG TPA: GEVED domain-containing protein, partial [Pirellulaceae bacterium]|nr:GEVED domain-containing protein [Pirellulaceae bacterium]